MAPLEPFTPAARRFQGPDMSIAPQKLLPLAQLSRPVAEWVEQVRQLTEPAQIHWCDGSDAEYVRLRD